MLGLLLTLVFCVSVALGGAWALSRVSSLDPAERLGLGGLLGLGLIGWLTFFVGLVPGGFRAWMVVLGAGIIVGLALASRGKSWRELVPTMPRGAQLLAGGVLTVLLLIPIVNALAPSDTMDWDSLAYHLAVPKLWIEAGRMEYIPFIHHSNFPFTVENLFIWGLQWGGESGAKAFTVAYFGFGILALFGLARRWYGEAAGWWTALGFAGIPVVLWESGSGYIDVAHGLYAGLGILYIADWAIARRLPWWLPALFLGLAAGTKYTGLQIVFAAVVVGCSAAILAAHASPSSLHDLLCNEPRRQDGRATGLRTLAILITSLVIASPWLIRNTANTGNPVYPFFYERLGGRDWDSWRAAIYRDEQQTFGIGRTATGRDPAQLPAGVLGLAYQPGRYVNPRQTEGGGFPMGALGVAGLLGGLFLLIGGRPGRREGIVLGVVGLSFVMWFFLSQQSRYLTSLAVPLAVLGGGIAATKRTRGRLLAVVIGGQAAYSAWLIETTQTAGQLPVVLGRQSREDYLKNRVSFYEPAQALNDLAKGGKVALFDEVFGYLLDVPYFWANPGHSTRIPYERLDDGEAFADELQKQGFSHVYFNLQHQDREFAKRWIEAAGIGGTPKPLSADERNALVSDMGTRWKVLLAEASASGRLRPVRSFGNGVIWEVRAK